MEAKERTAALRAVKQLRKLIPEPGVLSMLDYVTETIKTPMPVILDKVPGGSLNAKARLIGVTRQTIYAWLRNGARPNTKQAVRLAELTGIKLDAIKGKKR